MPDVLLIVLACFIVLIASTVQTAIGFGLALIAVPFLVMIDPNMVPAPIVMVAFLQLLTSAWLHRASIQYKPILMAIVGRIPGTIIAIWLMVYFGETGLRIFIATAVLAAVFISLFNFTAKPNIRNHIIAGFFSGISGTTSGIGGPPIALLYQKESGDFVRANLSAYFVIGSVMSLYGMYLGGYVTVNSWWYGLMFTPTTFAGVWLGMKVKHYLRPSFMRPAILSLCGGSAVALLVTTLI